LRQWLQKNIRQRYRCRSRDFKSNGISLFWHKKSFIFLSGRFMRQYYFNEVKEKFDYTVTDFFDRIKISSSIEIAAIKKHPAILSFLTSAYFEGDEEVKDYLKAIYAGGEMLRNKMAFEGMDFSKFKDSVDMKLLMKMLSWIGDGYANQLSGKRDADLDALFKEFEECLDMLKKNFYKEEYL
jgi:hypothetical protein